MLHVVSALVPLDELFQRGRQIARLVRTALAQRLGEVFGNIPRPALGSIETNDANGVAVLAVQQIRDDGFEIGIFYVGLAPCLPKPAAEVIEHKINVLIIARRHNRGGLIGPRHYATPSTHRIQADGGRVVPGSIARHKKETAPAWSNVEFL